MHTTILKCLASGLLVALSAGCSSAPPACSSPDVEAVLSSLLQDEAEFGALAITVPSGLYAQQMLMLNPVAISQMQQRQFREAFSTVETAFAALDGQNEPIAVLGREALAAAKTSTFSISGLSTLGQTEHRSSCQFVVEFSLGLPSAEQLGIVIDDPKRTPKVQQYFDNLRKLKQTRTFEAYLSDDGKTYVELAAPP